MKKAKIMLTAVAIMAVVGGALAVTAGKVSGTVYTGPAVGAACNIAVSPATLKANPASSDPRTFATLIPGAPCIQTVTTTTL